MTSALPTVTGLALADVYRRYAGDVFGYVVNATGDRALGQDLTSETFVRACQHGHTYVDRGRPIRAWLVTIARNLLRDHVRSARRHPTTLIGSEGWPEVPSAPDRADDPEYHALQAEQRSHLFEALGSLPILQRECVYLRFIAGLSVAEVATALARNQPAVRALQHRAIVNLREVLACQSI